MPLFLFLPFLFLVHCTSQTETPVQQVTSEDLAHSSKALFAGGCFWCVESAFDKLDGVLSTTSGFAGGQKINPNYKEVSSGQTKHVESVLVHFNPKKITYSQLLHHFWREINPTDAKGQFVDRGPQYRPVIFFFDEEQKRLATDSKVALGKLEKFKKPITVEIIKATPFYPAEDYHQDYHHKNPIRYKYYRNGSGRDQYLKKIWGKKK